MKLHHFAAVAAIFSIVGRSPAALAQDAPKSITTAAHVAHAPWNFMTADGKLHGFEVELANDLYARPRTVA